MRTTRSGLLPPASFAHLTEPDRAHRITGKQQPEGIGEMNPRPNLKPTVRNSEFFLKRMNASLAEAKDAALPNVRNQALRAAAAWQEMYEKAQQFAKRQNS
jgi:hypothetical protein